METLRQEIMDLLAQFSKVSVKNITPTHRLIEDLNLDSLQRMEMLSVVADHHRVDPDLERVMSLKTVQDVINLMEEVCAQKLQSSQCSQSTMS